MAKPYKHPKSALPTHTPDQSAVAAPLLHYREVEAAVGLGERYIRRLMRRGAFPAPTAVGKSGQLGWDPAVVAAWISARK